LILETFRVFWTFFQDDLAHISIFSRLSTKAHMLILIVDLDSLWKIESNEYNIMDMRRLSIFSSRHMMVVSESFLAFLESLCQFRQVSNFWDQMAIFGNLYF
jgi:hypothetical protein